MKIVLGSIGDVDVHGAVVSRERLVEMAVVSNAAAPILFRELELFNSCKLVNFRVENNSLVADIVEDKKGE